MDLYEHQGKELFAAHDVAVPDAVVVETPEQAHSAAERFGGRAAVKAQVQIGGRGKGGGIFLAKSPDEAAEAARRMLDEGFKGMSVTRVLVERLVDIAGEFYCAITLDRAAGQFLAMVSSEGGVDVEEIARTNPQAIRRQHIGPLLGMREFQVRYLTSHLPPAAREGAAALLPKLWEVLTSEDATLVEVNPMALLRDGSVIPLDAKVAIDDNALYRHPDLAALASAFPVEATQARANEKGLQYVKLDGEIGIIGNGAGLVMSTLDVVAQAGGRPANFLDVGGGASAEMMATSMDVVVSDPQVRSVLVNVFGGITRCDVAAQGILSALGRLEATAPIVVRLDGTNAEEGRRILEDAAHPQIVPAATMLEAADRAVELSRAATGAA